MLALILTPQVIADNVKADTVDVIGQYTSNSSIIVPVDFNSWGVGSTAFAISSFTYNFSSPIEVTAENKCYSLEFYTTGKSLSDYAYLDEYNLNFNAVSDGVTILLDNQSSQYEFSEVTSGYYRFFKYKFNINVSSDSNLSMSSVTFNYTGNDIWEYTPYTFYTDRYSFNNWKNDSSPKYFEIDCSTVNWSNSPVIEPEPEPEEPEEASIDTINTHLINIEKQVKIIVIGIVFSITCITILLMNRGLYDKRRF